MLRYAYLLSVLRNVHRKLRTGVLSEVKNHINTDEYKG